MSLNAVATYGPTPAGISPASRPREPASKEASGSEMPYVSPVLRIDVDQGGPVMAYRDRQTGEVTEQRAARLESARAQEAAEPENPTGSLEQAGSLPKGGSASRELAAVANTAYQQTASGGPGKAEIPRPTSLSFEA